MVALLRAGCNVVICNLFTQSDYAVTEIGIDSSRSRVDAVSSARLCEDREAVSTVLAHISQTISVGELTLCDSGWLDAPLRLQVHSEQVVLSPLSEAQALAQAREFASQVAHWQDYDAVFAPLALGDHIDHRVARDTARCAVPRERLAFYQDLPYAARMTDEERIRQTATALLDSGIAPETPALVREHYGATLKRELALCYPSQIAPSVAAEIATYGTTLAATDDDAAEAWFAPPSLAERVQQVLQGS